MADNGDQVPPGAPRPPKRGRKQTIFVCLACNSRVSGNKGKCSRPEPGRGCRSCREMGLVCVYEGQYLLPCPLAAAPRATNPTACTECQLEGRRCDFKRPCDRCFDVGRECTGPNRGCFHRGVESDSFYGYYLNLGYGPMGVDDRNTIPGKWIMSDEYHLEYLEWKTSFRNNSLLAELTPAPPTGRTIAEDYQQLLQLAANATQRGVSLNMNAVRERLQQDLQASIPLNESQSARDLGFYIKLQTTAYAKDNNPRYNEAALSITPITGLFADIILRRALNPGGNRDYNWIAPLRNVVSTPEERPKSPGSARPLYWIPWNTTNQQAQIIDNSNLFPADHPERVDMRKLVRNPFMEHPVENGESVLSSIPFWRYWENGIMYFNDRPCQEESHSGMSCQKPTRAGCEDYTHFGEGMPICEESEQTSRTKFLAAFNPLVMNMRQYLCWECTTGSFPILTHLAGSGAKVYYDISQGGNLPDFRAESLVATGLSQWSGGHYGPPLEITGCSCAMKLFGRRICSPHRLHYLMLMEETISSMRAYCQGLYGKAVCPSCRKNAGIDAYQFQGTAGGQNAAFISWVCLVCQGWVFVPKSDASKGPLPMNHLLQIYDEHAPIPYNCIENDKHAAAGRLITAAEAYYNQ
ncbi:hypothetical protein F5Y13DRAFT_199964 [Hypoxylon sp. FL1857]|nr:hypothetical protein F5Y13DRAFT_199964 [Hypoxylon sp. FL1857]